MQIFYILGEFPSASEYFIQQEIIALNKSGLGIRILALNRPRRSSNHSDTVRSLLSETIYYQAYSTTTILSALYCLSAHFASYSKEWLKIARTLFRSPVTAARRTKHLLMSSYFIFATRTARQKHFHAHFASLPASVASLISRITGLSYSISAHAHDIYTKNDDLPEKLEKAEFVVTCTRNNQKILADKNINKPVELVYHGLQFANWPFLERQPLDPAQTVHVLTAARLVEKKGIIYLLDAIRLLRAELKVMCTIFGDGPERSALEKFAREAGIQEQVIFKGHLSQEALLPFYHTHQLFVLPCIVAPDGDMDGLPNVLLEALSTGIPVITTQVSAIPELIKQRETGILVPEKNASAIAQAVRDLVADPHLYKHVSEKGRRLIVERFDIDASTRRLLNLFNTLRS